MEWFLVDVFMVINDDYLLCGSGKEYIFLFFIVKYSLY